MAATQNYNMVNGGVGVHPGSTLLPPPPPPPQPQLLPPVPPPPPPPTSLDEPPNKKQKPDDCSISINHIAEDRERALKLMPCLLMKDINYYLE